MPNCCWSCALFHLSLIATGVHHVSIVNSPSIHPCSFNPVTGTCGSLEYALASFTRPGTGAYIRTSNVRPEFVIRSAQLDVVAAVIVEPVSIRSELHEGWRSGAGLRPITDMVTGSVVAASVVQVGDPLYTDPNNRAAMTRSAGRLVDDPDAVSDTSEEGAILQSGQQSELRCLGRLMGIRQPCITVIGRYVIY